ncbi:MAG: transposase [Symploca sp. SIO3C6]|nr:transposase [Symploca sp. SIO3C6]
MAEQMEAPALPFRTALGALIIKEKLGITARETVEQIQDNPYLQDFIGRVNYSSEDPFDPSLLVRFRERITANLVNQVNEIIINNKSSLFLEA